MQSQVASNVNRCAEVMLSTIKSHLLAVPFCPEVADGVPPPGPTEPETSADSTVGSASRRQPTGSGTGSASGSGSSGQLPSTFSIASASARVTHSSYSSLTPTCRATYSHR